MNNHKNSKKEDSYLKDTTLKNKTGQMRMGTKAIEKNFLAEKQENEVKIIKFSFHSF